jgi:C4-dicarboxylate transporter, DctQ subunit
VHYQPSGPLSRLINEFEEIAIATMLGLMTAITFANVIARYVFDSNLLWALEATVHLFAWLVLFGVSYAVKISSHLGVDALLTRLSPRVQRICGLLALSACLLYAGMLVYGSWEYWHKFAFKLSFLETDDLPFPVWMQSLFGLVQDGEPMYEKLPRFIPYSMLPIGMTLFFLRLVQAGWHIWTGKKTLLIASHEADEMIEEVHSLTNDGKEG